MTEIFLDILDKQRLKTFSLLADFRSSALLGGGTALALQIKHRKSFDFDCFVSKPIPSSLYAKVKKIFQESPIKLVDSSDQLTVQLSTLIELTFVYYWYPPLHPTISTNSLSLVNKLDIASDKAFTLGRRNAWRDYVDFYFLLKEKHVTLSAIIKDAVKRFDNEFSPKLFLEQLCYTEDIHDTNVEFINKPLIKNEITSFLENQVKTYMQKMLEK